MEILKENWIEILFAFMAFLKVVVNLTPSEKDNKIFDWLDKLIDLFIPNIKKGGKIHNKNLFKK